MFVSLKESDDVFLSVENEGNNLMGNPTQCIPSFGGVLLFAYSVFISSVKCFLIWNYEPIYIAKVIDLLTSNPFLTAHSYTF